MNPQYNQPRHLSGGDPAGGVECEHPVKQLESGGGHEEGEIFPHPPPVLLLGLELLEAGQVDHLRPDRRAGRPAHSADHHQLGKLLVRLQYSIQFIVNCRLDIQTLKR